LIVTNAGESKGARQTRTAEDGPDLGGQTPATGWEYLGVGCFTAFAGLAGGGMIAVLVAKIMGAVQGCTPDKETGAPCNWFTFAVYGAMLGMLIVPIVSVWFFRRGRARANNDRG
jgi:hypothetical protein